MYNELGALPMANPNDLLTAIEQKRFWSYFHKDWIVEIRQLLRPQVPPTYSVFVESDTVLVSPEFENPTFPKPDLAIARPSAVETQSKTTSATAAVIELDEPYEIFTRYSLTIRQAVDQQIVAALEILSPSNKGIGSRLDRNKYLDRRDAHAEAGISFLEIDALKFGERLLPDSLVQLASFERNAWTSFHHDGRRKLRGYGWNQSDNLPIVPWHIEGDLHLLVDLDASARTALRFNPWESLVAADK
jgi:hypothetical protein